MNYKNKLLLGLVSLTLWGCQDDYLDVLPNAPTPDIALSDPAVAPEVVNAIYDIMQDFNFDTFPYYGVSEIASDNSDKGSSPGDTGTYQKDMDQFTFDPTTAAFANLWTLHFQAIARANQAMGFLETLDIDTDLKNRLMGEAKFLRALFYFRLAQMFGGVPLIAKTPDPTNIDEINATLVRATLPDTYAFIEQDLTDAVAALPNKSDYPATDLGRATKGAALSLLAKVNLYEENWQEAQDLSQQVITSAQYELEPDFIDIFKQSHENGPESIFEIQGRGAEPQDGPGDYYITQGARGAGGWGWGFNTPSENLVNSFENGDERLAATVIFRGDTLYDDRPVNPNADNERYNYKAYLDQSFAASEKNVPLLRYAEVLLIHAEASAQLGDMAAAQTSLDKVRMRAELPVVPATLDNIYKERRAELAMENDRLYDLRRTGRAAAVLNAAGIPYVSPKHDLYPIPQAQIDISNGLLTQNPGYN